MATKNVHPLVGFHLGPGGNPTGIGDWMRKLNGAGIPFCLKSVDHYGPIWEAQQIMASSSQLTGDGSEIQHRLVFRLSDIKEGPDAYAYDTPPYKHDKYKDDPEGGAEYHWAKHMARLPAEFDRARVWLEVMNEVDRNLPEWLARFCIKIASLAQRDGIKVAFLGFSSGEPEPTFWEHPKMLELLELVGNNRERLAIALHEYSYELSSLLIEAPFKLFRFMYLLHICDKHGLPRPRLFITEMGWTLNKVPGPEQALADLQLVMDVYSSFCEIAGAFIWYLGGGFSNIADLAQQLIKPVGEWVAATVYQVPDFKKIDFLPNINSWQFEPVDNNDGNGGDQVGDNTFANGVILTHLNGENKMVMIYLGQFDGPMFNHVDWPANLQVSIDPGTGAMMIELPDEATAVQLIAGGMKTEPEPGPGPDPEPGPDPAGHWPVPLLGQRDPRWASKTLGQPTGHQKTIGSWGCLMVAYNSLAQWWDLTEMMPEQFNAALVAAGAFKDQFIQPGALKTLYPDRVAYDGFMLRDNGAEMMRSEVRRWIDLGWPVLARVDFNPSDSDIDQHWVLICGYIGSTDFWMMDPWYGDYEIVNKRYAIPGSDLVECIFYHPLGGVKPEPDPEPGPEPGPAAVDVLSFIMGKHRMQFDKGYKLGDGSTGTQTTQIWHLPSGSDWLYIKGEGEHTQHERLGLRSFNGYPWIYRFDDTSQSLDTFYIHYNHITGEIGAPWVPRYMVPGQWYESTKRVISYNKKTCQPISSAVVVDRLRLVAPPGPIKYEQTGIELHGITIQWEAGGELYDFCEGNTGFRDPQRDFWFMGWLYGRQDKQPIKPGCIDLGW